MSSIYVNKVSKTFKRYEKQEKLIDNFFHRKYEEKTAVDGISFEVAFLNSSLNPFANSPICYTLIAIALK